MRQEVKTMADDIKLTKLASCAGCGAKVGAGTLQKLLKDLKVREDPNLLVGFDRSDDAAVYRLRDDLAVVQTLDFFPPIADDPYTYGAIAATNALSDVYAMGGEPVTALNILAVPEKMEKTVVQEILRGGYDKVYEAGAVIAGGHSILNDSPLYGLSVTGLVHPEKLWSNAGAKPGDVLFLTKKLGAGIVTTAAKAELTERATLDEAYAAMTTLNRAARDEMVRYAIHACTDVTGFGFFGHLYEMTHGSGVRARVDTRALRFLAQAEELARDGILPAGLYRNRRYAESAVDAGDTPLYLQDLLYDPQTSGGLLFAVDAKDADALEAALKDRVPCLQRVGVIEACESGKEICLE